MSRVSLSLSFFLKEELFIELIRKGVEVINAKNAKAPMRKRRVVHVGTTLFGLSFSANVCLCPFSFIKCLFFLSPYRDRRHTLQLQTARSFLINIVIKHRQ